LKRSRRPDFHGTATARDLKNFGEKLVTVLEAIDQTVDLGAHQCSRGGPLMLNNDSGLRESLKDYP